MSQNQNCPQCNAYNHPRREKCWQCGQWLVAPHTNPTPQNSKITETQFKILLMSGVSILMLALLVVLGIYFVFPQGTSLFPTATPQPLYELVWKIEEDHPLQYLAQSGNGVDSISMGKNLPDKIATRIPGDIVYTVEHTELPIYRNYILDTALQKNAKGNISVEMEVTGAEISPNPTPEEPSPYRMATNAIPFLNGEVSTQGQLVSTDLNQDQKNLMSLFFELPKHAVRVGDTWSIGAICIVLADGGQFTVETSSIENQVTLSRIYETPTHEVVAVLDYRIVETLEGTQMIPFAINEPVDASVQCNGSGQGEFLIEQGHWKQFDFQYAITITGFTDETMSQNFSLSLPE